MPKNETAVITHTEANIHERRKADHIRINLEENVTFNKLTTGLENYFFMHQALPSLIWRQWTPPPRFLANRCAPPCSSPP